MEHNECDSYYTQIVFKVIQLTHVTILLFYQLLYRVHENVNCLVPHIFVIIDKKTRFLVNRVNR